LIISPLIYICETSEAELHWRCELIAKCQPFSIPECIAIQAHACSSASGHLRHYFSLLGRPPMGNRPRHLPQLRLLPVRLRCSSPSPQVFRLLTHRDHLFEKQNGRYVLRLPISLLNMAKSPCERFERAVRCSPGARNTARQQPQFPSSPVPGSQRARFGRHLNRRPTMNR